MKWSKEAEYGQRYGEIYCQACTDRSSNAPGDHFFAFLINGSVAGIAI